MGREAGAGIRMGNTYKSMADSCQCMAKTTTILYSNQPPTNKINGKKKKSSSTAWVSPEETMNVFPRPYICLYPSAKIYFPANSGFLILLGQKKFITCVCVCVKPSLILCLLALYPVAINHMVHITSLQGLQQCLPTTFPYPHDDFFFSHDDFYLSKVTLPFGV